MISAAMTQSNNYELKKEIQYRERESAADGSCIFAAAEESPPTYRERSHMQGVDGESHGDGTETIRPVLSNDAEPNC